MSSWSVTRIKAGWNSRCQVAGNALSLSFATADSQLARWRRYVKLNCVIGNSCSQLLHEHHSLPFSELHVRTTRDVLADPRDGDFFRVK